MLKMSIRVVALVLTLAVVHHAAADEQVAPEPVAAEKPWSLKLTLDYTSQYIFRGYNLNPGADFIFQPGAEFSYDLVKNDAVTVSAYAAVWANFVDADGPHSPKSFYEFDVIGGVNVNYRDFVLGVVYTHYSYPNRSYRQQQELGFTLTYDDTVFWENAYILAGLQPTVGYYVELEDRGDNDRNVYIELGLTPTFRSLEIADGTQLTFSIPMVVGLSGDGYFTGNDGRNETFGYYSVGISAEFSLGFVPETMGAWSVTVGVDYIRLLADSAESANGGDEDDFVGRIGLTVGL